MSEQVRRSGVRLWQWAGRIVVAAVVCLGLMLLAAGLVIRHYWGPISVPQMMMNLMAVQTDGGGGSIVWISVLVIGVLPVVLTAVLSVGWYAWSRRRRSRGQQRGRRMATRLLAAFAVAAVAITGTASFASAVGLKQYVKSARSPQDIGGRYVQPVVTGDTAKRNLVVIYLESGEATLTDDTLFEKNAFSDLERVTEPAKGWRSVPDFHQYEGGGWTMAGITSTQCGIPLKGAAAGIAGNDIGAGTDRYLSGITCLGDVLSEHGYKNVFLGGANPAFSGKDIFLRTHGYTTDKGLADWRAAGEPAKNFRSDWGLSDERLMAHAEEEIDHLHAEADRTGQPFNLSMLTLDTHEPVHVYDSCSVDTRNEVTSVFACSMAQVAGFVKHMEDLGYLEDTSVVIMGDHLKHMSAGDAFHEQLDHHPDRTIFNRVWIPGTSGETSLRAGADQLNMYPTLLEAAGLSLQDSAAGLGVSVLRPDVPAYSAQGMPAADYKDLLTSLSPDFYSRAWGQREDEG